MSFSSSTVSIGDSTKQADYARLMANTVYLKNEAATFTGAKTFQSSVVLNGSVTIDSNVISFYKEWRIDGHDLSIVGTGYPALAALDSTHVALIDTGGDELRTYIWDGSDWTLEGNGLSIAGIAHPALAALDSTHVAFIDTDGDELRTYRNISYLAF